MTLMDKPTYRGICEFMIHKWVKGFDKWSDGFWGMHTPTGGTTAAGQQG
jgi:hypothetical protein